METVKGNRIISREYSRRKDMNKSGLVGVAYTILLVLIVCGIGHCIGWDYVVGIVTAFACAGIAFCWVLRGYRDLDRKRGEG